MYVHIELYMYIHILTYIGLSVTIYLCKYLPIYPSTHLANCVSDKSQQTSHSSPGELPMHVLIHEIHGTLNGEVTLQNIVRRNCKVGAALA